MRFTIFSVDGALYSEGNSRSQACVFSATAQNKSHLLAESNSDHWIEKQTLSLQASLNSSFVELKLREAQKWDIKQKMLRTGLANQRREGKGVKDKNKEWKPNSNNP